MTAAMRRVALFSTQFLPYSQTFIHEELKLHARYGAEVFTRRRLHADRFPHPQVHVAGPGYGYTRRCRGFDRIFRERPFDLVHAHFGTGAVYAERWARRFGLPLVVTFHGHDVSRLHGLERFHPSSWRYARASGAILRDMRLGLCASQELLELLVELGAPERNLRLHQLGVDLEAFRPPEQRAPQPLRVIMIGRMVGKKGFEYGVRAFARVSANQPDMRLTIIGDGERRPAIERLIAGLGLGERVELTGSLPSAEVAGRLRDSHVLLAPSVVDALGDRESGLIVVKEASACGVVPIGTYHGGIPEIIDDGQTGFLVRERDVEGLAQCLAQLSDDASLRERLAVAARDKMEREYDNRACVERLERYYDEALGLPTLRPRRT